MEKTVTKKVNFTKNNKERANSFNKEKRVLTEEDRKKYARECTYLAKKNNLQFELVMLYKKDVKRASYVTKLCSEISIKKDSEIYNKLVKGGEDRIEALKELKIPFKGVDINRLDLIKFGLIKVEE